MQVFSTKIVSNYNKFKLIMAIINHNKYSINYDKIKLNENCIEIIEII